jgi:hypothetical protein
LRFKHRDTIPGKLPYQPNIGGRFFCILTPLVNSGIETRLAIEELGRGIHPLGRNWNSGLVTKFTIEKFGEGSSSPN